MSESTLSSDAPMIVSGQSAIPVGAGALVRAAREAQGLHIAMLAVSLKVPVKKLEALEADRYDLLPDIVFARALASSVCRALKIDAGPVLAALPRSDLPKIKTDEQGLNTTFNDPGRGADNTLLALVTKPLGMAVLLLLVGIVVITFFPTKSANDPVAAVPADGSPAVIPMAPVVSDAENQMAPQPQGSASVAALTLPDSTIGAGSAGAANLALGPSLGTSAPVDSPAAALVVGSEGVLSLRANESSWVEVVDAQGVLQLRRTLVKDDIVPVAGALPLSVVVGRADAVSVVIRGQPFDTASVSKNNVARFEVK